MQCCIAGDGAAAEGDERARLDCRDKSSLLSMKAFITRVIESVRLCITQLDTAADAQANRIHSQVVQSSPSGAAFQTMNSIRGTSLTGIAGGFAAPFAQILRTQSPNEWAAISLIRFAANKSEYLIPPGDRIGHLSNIAVAIATESVPARVHHQVPQFIRHWTEPPSN